MVCARKFENGEEQSSSQSGSGSVTPDGIKATPLLSLSSKTHAAPHLKTHIFTRIRETFYIKDQERIETE